MTKRQVTIFILATLLIMVGQCSLFESDKEGSQDVLIAYDLFNNSAGRYDNDIWLTDFDGTNERILLGGDTNDFDPQFDPLGSGIYFISNSSGFRDLFFTDTLGQTLT